MHWVRTDLDVLGTEKRIEYKENRPFPNIVIEGLFNEEVLDSVLEEFPDLSWSHGKIEYDNEHELKLASRGEEHFGPQTKLFLHFLNSKPFIDFLEELTGIDGLVPDPHFLGGGYHELKHGGFLNVHADFNRHRKMRLDRRVNLIIYLNKGWAEENGGQLELWDGEMKKCHKTVLPEYNTAVVFSTTDFSYHGNPTPVNRPDGGSRKSLALYYYTNGRPEEQIHEGLEEHGTIFKLEPGQKVRNAKLTHKLKDIASLFVPPIVFKMRDVLFG